VKSDTSPVLAAALVDGSVVFVDAVDGHVVSRCDEVTEDPPNLMAFASQWLVHCSDDSCVRCLSIKGGVVHAHMVMEPAQDGKRPRCAPIDHAAIIDGGTAYVAVAGRLLHACRVPEGDLEHSTQFDSPVRAVCAAACSEATQWSYAVAIADGVRLISRAGETLRELTSKRILRSLATHGPWLAAGTMDGAVELWDLVTPRQASAQDLARALHTLNGACGSDGLSLGWRPDGGGLAVSGKRAAVFDFTGSNAPHPYRMNVARSAAPIRAGQPDPVPRVCMVDGAQSVAWAPCAAESAASRLATVSDQGVVRVFQPHRTPLRKGGNGDPAQPQRMKPQLYTFLRQDAAHPSGENAPACALMWLREDMVAVAYFTGEIVAWRVAGE
jgi:hypothetical protein